MAPLEKYHANVKSAGASSGSVGATGLAAIDTVAQWLRLLFGLVLIFAVFQWSASTLGSDRGQTGLIVGALVVGGILAVERFVFKQRVVSGAHALGLGLPRAKGLFVVGGIAALLVIVIYAFVQASGSRLSLFPSWWALLPGLFAQAGIAEETLFRGYLFGHLRVGRTFWRAASLSMLPFGGVHLVLFFTMPWPIALAALLLAVVLSFPFAHLFELGGATIWAPALLHFIIQGTVKILVVSPDSATFALVWMVASGLIPALSLLVARPEGGPREWRF